MHRLLLLLPDHKKDGEVQREGDGGIEEEDRAEGAVQSLEGKGLKLPQHEAEGDEEGRGRRQVVEHAQGVQLEVGEHLRMEEVGRVGQG